MKIAIISEIMKSKDKRHEYDPIRYHHVGFWLAELSLRHEVTIIDWRDIETDFTTKKHVFQSANGPQIGTEKKKLEDLGDIIFIRQSGPMHYTQRGSLEFGYSEQEYRAFLENIKSFSKPVVNDPTILALAISKEYLVELERNKYPVIPSLEVSKPISKKSLRQHIINLHSCTEVVVKPKNYSGYGAGVRKLSSFQTDEEFNEYLNKFKPLLAQPVLEGIYTEGEYSLIYLGNKVSHAVRKHTGSFLINHDFNPKYTRFEPSEEHLKVAENIREFLGRRFNCSMEGVMRLDFIKKDGKFLLNEIEMINPGLYIRDMNIYGEFLKKFESYLEHLHLQKTLLVQTQKEAGEEKQQNEIK